MTAPLTRIEERRVLFVMAAEAEYGPALKRLMRPLFTGVGPVEGAAVTADALARLSLAGETPDLLVSLGSAGSRRLARGAVYQASEVSYRDMDASPLGFPTGVTPFLDLPAVLPLPLRLPGVPVARLSSGANIVSGAAYDRIDADMVDMESFAHLRAAMRAGVPMLALRGISDGTEELTHISGWTEYLHIVDENLAAALADLPELVRGL